MPGDFARRGRDRAGPAQCRERGFAAQAVGVAAGGEQELGCSVGSDAVRGAKPRVGGGDELVELGFELVPLTGQLDTALGESLEGEHDRPFDGIAIGSDLDAGQDRDSLLCAHGAVALADGRGCGDQLVVDLDHRSPAGLACRAAGVVQRPDPVDGAVLDRSGAVAAHRSPRSLVGVDRVGLAQPAPLGAFRAHHLDHVETLADRGPGDSDTVGGGALDPDADGVAMAGDERQGTAVAVGARGEFAVVQVAALGADHGDVDRVVVGVDTGVDLGDFIFDCHAGCCLPLVRVGPSRVGRQDSNEALARLL